MDAIDQCNNYLISGGLFNPELSIHDNVRDLIRECRDQMAKQDAEIGIMRRIISSQNDSIVQLKKALERIADSSNWGEDGCWDADSYPDEIAKEALGDDIWDADNRIWMRLPRKNWIRK